MSHPFRTHLRRPAESSDDSLAELAGILQPDEVDWSRWLEDPDEAVRVMAVRLAQQKLSPEVRDRVTTFAVREADEAGLVWTPMLEALASSGCFAYRYADRNTDESSLPPQQRTMLGQIERLVPWLEADPSPEAVSELLRFPAVRGMVARHAPSLTREQFEILMPDFAKALSRNPGAVRRFAAPIADHALALLKSDNEAKKALRILESLHDGGADLGSVVDALIDHAAASGAPPGLSSWLAAHPLLTEARLERMIQANRDLDHRRYVSREQSLYNLLLKEQASPALWQRLFDTGIRFQGLLAAENLSADRIRFIFEREGAEGAVAKRITQHPRAPMDVLVAIAESDSRPDVRRLLALLPRARREERIARVLATSTIAEVRQELLEDAETPADVFRTLFSDYVRTNPAQARGVFLSRMRANPTHLDPSDVAAFFTDEEAEIRELAIQAIGKAKTASPPSPSR